MEKVYLLGKDGKTGQAITERLKDNKQYRLVDEIAQADLIVTSPGVPPQQFPITVLPIISEIELAYRLNPTPVIAISGTNGKSTATKLIADMLQVPYVGNIGIPYITLDKISEYVSVEVSSYQLHTIINFRPKIAVLLNITPDHIKWHRSLDGYIAAKARIFMNQTAEDYLVYNADDPILQELVKQARSQLVPFTAPDKIAQSYEAARKVLEITGNKRRLDFDHFCKHEFKNLAHRCELVTAKNGIRVINDSKATNPDSTMAALERYNNDKKLIMIMGGREKGTDLSEMAAKLKEKARLIVLTGECRENFAKAFAGQELYIQEDFQLAVQKALELAQPGDDVLLSPATASFDHFSCFEERGERFKQIVLNYFQK